MTALLRPKPEDGAEEPSASVRVPSLPDVAAQARELGLRRVELVAWRDLDHPEAGGSEIHADRIATHWARAGLEVRLTTSRTPGAPAEVTRGGYRARRVAGRYAVFPRVAMENLLGPPAERDALVEIWNGMPFLSPLWASGPHLVFLHHVHAELWRMVLPRGLAAIGEAFERRVAPRLYRRSVLVTLSSSSRAEIVERLGLRPEQVRVVPPGVDERFSPGGARHPHPLVVAVGRLVPVKRFDRLIDVLVQLKAQHPTLEAELLGEGWARPALEARIAAAGAGAWLRLPGRVDDDALLDAYRRAWVLAAPSQREGWGMTLSEAAACGTPAVASRIPGHEDAVHDGETGLLVDDDAGFFAALDRLLKDYGLRHRLGRAAAQRATQLRWERTAAATLAELTAQAAARRRQAGS
ncbi:glycosyltransferase family 4 protein [Aciditerrimonas ferrireducens]|nr:glycosyltransferase family 4 protein [Aciditerrimonas ferrireducens]MCK4176778.1 glycosyltransferase family 4 protein [Aciditerrimonas ferrireducens]